MQEIKKEQKLPQEGEIVMGDITKVSGFGAFVKLEEYAGVEGMLHISEISSKWIKNIRDYVKEGQRVIVKVIRINPEKGHIDLSLKSVKASQKKEKIESYKRRKRAVHLVELASERIKDKEGVQKILEILENSTEEMYSLFEKSLHSGREIFLKVGLPEKWADALAKIAQEQIEIPKVTIKGIFELTSNAPDGAEVIRNALSNAMEACKTKDATISMKYLGAPKYKIEITAENYKIAESCLELFSKEVIGAVVKNRGTGKLIRE